MDGYDESGTPAKNKTIELFTPSPNMNGVGQITTISTRGAAGQPTDQGELYPRNFLMPSGRTLVAGPDPADSWFYNQIGAAPGNAFSWGELPNFNGGETRQWSTSVLEPGTPAGSSKVTIMGGTPFGGGTQRTAETIDDANPGQGWQPAPSLNIGRSHHNTVLLPDGSKVAVGGGVGSGAQGLYTFEDEQRQIELYDPTSGSWRLGASQAEGRAYHSTAALLPDGRVISAGDNYNGTIGQPGGDRTDTAEIYQPPYLFKGARPTISAAPPSVAWGDTFGINSPDPVSRAVLMAPAATTHGYDMNQRHVELQVTNTVAGTGIDVVSPPNARVAPPGYYMLFLLNGQGVPSVSSWVRLDPSAPDRPPIGGPPPQRTLTVTPPTGTGTGTITGTGISCPGDCTQTYADGTAVTLAANPTGGSSFSGWSGDCTGTGPCNLTMNANKAVSGSFSAAPPPQRTLTVTPPTGTGTGTITGTGISCPGDCTQTYADGTAVTLAANPTGGSSFSGWSGDCTGTGPCNLTMNANKAVSGSFTAGGGSGGTQLLRPNADVTSQWTVCCLFGTPAWDALNENVTQAQSSIPSELFIYASALNRVTEVALSDAALNGTPTTSRAWFYMNTAAGQSVRADVIWGGSVRASSTVSGGQGYQWRSFNVTPPDQAAVNDLRIRFTVTAAGSSSGNVFATYFELVTVGGGPPPQRTLTVTPPTGTGTGTITGTGISCPGDCTQTYADGTAVTLAANPTGGSSFSGWSGDCTGTGPCNLTMNANKAVSGSFSAAPPPQRTLTVTPPTGTGTGTITGTGISCPGDCTQTYADGTAVTLAANPTGGSSFSGWSGDCTGTGPCNLTMNANKAVSGSFSAAPPPQRTLTVTPPTGTGTGTITGTGISCPGDCTQTYADGTAVTLAANPTGGSSFSGWSGDCTGTGPCNLTMNANKAVSGSFSAAPPPQRTLTVTPPTGTGTGTITGTGISCPGDCTQTYADGTAVTLAANPTGGSSFSGWSGDCTGTGPCNLTMNANKAVSGSFSAAPPPQRTLTVTPPTGTGTGTITGTGISCPGDCTQTYADGTAVTLAANPTGGSSFSGWSGDCTGTGPCNLTMNANKAVSGSFTAGGGSGGTQLLRPNADVTSQWTVCCLFGTPAWDALNENVTQAQSSIPSELFIYASALNRVTEVALSDAALNGTPTTSRAWFYMNTAAGQSVRADVIWGGSVRASSTVSGGQGYQWRSFNVTPPDQAAVNDLRIRFTVTAAGSSSGNVFATYFELVTVGG